jgi:8-oxo-dGTP diphosphatase
MNRRIAVRAIIYRDGKIFALRQIKKGKPNDYWSTPGGGLDPMEPLEDCLVREMIEETGVKPTVGRLLFIQQFKESDDEEQLEFFYHVTNVEDYESIDLSQTSHGEVEISEHGFIQIGHTQLLPEFIRTLDFEDILQRQNVLVFNYLP